jgi:hypothetical protein
VSSGTTGRADGTVAVGDLAMGTDGPSGRDEVPSFRMIRPDVATETPSEAAYSSGTWSSVSYIRQKCAMSGAVADAGPVQWREADDHWSKR